MEKAREGDTGEDMLCVLSFQKSLGTNICPSLTHPSFLGARAP